jgi:hypothetical protein
MALDADHPLTFPPDRPVQSVPDGLLALPSEGTPPTVAVPRLTDDVGPMPADRAATPHVERNVAVGRARPLEDPDVVRGSAGRAARPQRRGPKTAAGKARIGLNAITHAISSARLVVPGESTTEWELYRQAIVDALVPAGPVEMALTERVAMAIWRLRRVAAYEGAAIAERQHLATPSARLLPHPQDIDKIIRYEAHLTRHLYQALQQLEAMRAERGGQPTPLLRVDIQQLTGTPDAANGSAG